MVISLDFLMPFMLVVVRCLTFFSIGPLFAQRKVPLQVQVLLAVATSIALFPIVDRAEWVFEGKILGLVLLIGREILLGGLLGLVAGVAFAAIRFSGFLIGVQMGFSLSTVFDPASGQQMPIVGRLQELFAVLIFLVLDGHHILLRALGFSLERVAPGGFMAVEDLPAVIAPIGAAVFFLALQVGAPVLAALFLTDTALGFVARSVPQMNVFLVGIPAKIGVGIALLFRRRRHLWALSSASRSVRWRPSSWLCCVACSLPLALCPRMSAGWRDRGQRQLRGTEIHRALRSTPGPGS